MGSLLVETLLVHLPAFLPAIPGHPGLIEYIDAMLIGVLLMVMLWFRPQGVVPERVRKSTVIDKLLLNSNGASAVGESLHDEEATSVSQ
ncbi:MAG: hypothetical protein KGJ42_08405, partial [Acidobacteriota bacterium]|nr:hypothetical protein [Acidobacteriota bacterium]